MAEQRKNRIAGFELLRVVCMFMVLLLHFVSGTECLAVPGRPMTPARAAGGLLESFSIVAVNCYVLISGYFLVNTPCRMTKAARLLFTVWFYTLLIPAALHLFGIPIEETDIWSAAQAILPVSMEQYWFVSAYVLMYLFSPVLSAGVHAMSAGALRVTVSALMIFTCILPSISPVPLNLDGAGYDLLWFLTLYLIAAYIRLYGIDFFEGKKRRGRAGVLTPALVYVISCLLIYALYLVLNRISETTGLLSSYSTVPFHYNTILCLAGAIGLFYVFKGIGHFRGERAVLRISRLTFGVYLVHQQVDMRDLWIRAGERLFGEISQDAPGAFLLEALLYCLAAYAVFLLIDGVRSCLFSLLAKGAVYTRLYRFLGRVDEHFAQ